MFIFARQTWALTVKNILIAALRRPISTTIRALILPFTLVLFVSYSQYFFNPPQLFGVGSPTPVLSLSTALSRSSPGRNTIVFVHNGHTGSAITAVIDEVAQPFREAGKTVAILESDADTAGTCLSTRRGSSNCFGAVIFYSSMTEPTEQSVWNYTVRSDNSLGSSFDVTSTNNDAQIYHLPLQHAIDSAIVKLSSTNGDSTLRRVEQSLFTHLSEEARVSHARQSFLENAVNIFTVIFFLGMVGAVYQLTGFVATERENGLSQLIETMMPNVARWQPQVARLLSYHAAFTMIYFPSWLVTGIVLSTLIYNRSNAAIVIAYHLTVGLALVSYALVGAAFFKKAQLSGITVTIIAVVLAVIPQVLSPEDQTLTTVMALSLIFPSANYTYFMTFVGRWEVKDEAANLYKPAPESPWQLAGIVLWGFILIQILTYPILAAILENVFYGTASKARTVVSENIPYGTTVQLQAFSKTYEQSWLGSIFQKNKADIQAVKDLTLNAHRGQILMLLGRNGSGKSTTLDAIAGQSKITAGRIDIDGRDGLGLVPQKNVLWDDLTVEEHVMIFNNLKKPESRATKEEMRAMIGACDLVPKARAKAKTLSGGQKRKLQLAMMFAGGSSVCCIDEVSSGLDPLSRRKIWDILLAERGDRTIIMTTHFLDEADFLSDHIAILSKGTLVAEGPSISLKHRYGDGLSFHIPRNANATVMPDVLGVSKVESTTETVYTVSNYDHAAKFIKALDKHGIVDYKVSGPTLENVFLQLVDEHACRKVSEGVQLAAVSSQTPEYQNHGHVVKADATSAPRIKLHQGKHIGPLRQGWVLFRKRMTISGRNYLPTLGAVAIALIGAGASQLLLKDYEGIECASALDVTASQTDDSYNLATEGFSHLVAGPSSKITDDKFANLAQIYSANHTKWGYGIDDVKSVMQGIHTVSTSNEFYDYITTQDGTLEPGGIFLGDDSVAPQFAWLADPFNLHNGLVMQNMLNNILSNVSIFTSYAGFENPPSPELFHFSALIFCMYMGLVLACYPAIFALYPTAERLRNVRALHYSNGVRPVPLWLAHLAFDSVIVLAISFLVTALFSTGVSIWYHLPYLFVIFFLYGVASTLLGYLISLIARSQLAAWALCAGGQALFFLAYFGAYIGIAANVDTPYLQSTFNKVHFTIGIISPVANVLRSLFLSLNLYALSCDIDLKPWDIVAYGGPILYLIIQCLALLSLLLWLDSGTKAPRLFRKGSQQGDTEKVAASTSPDDTNEMLRVAQSTDGLRVLHLSKSYAGKMVVDDVTFGVRPGEIFALLGPNGAGKSTAISLIRGDIQPSDSRGDILVGKSSVLTDRALARSQLGVCPQFDAADILTVKEHLYFYARVRGVAEPAHNVNEVIRVFGLESFENRLAQKLSGGTKRKLSLAIAMIGNPSVLLLDEPSSGLDAASKRTMWSALAAISADRSVVLTTHSIEEADALAERVGIMSRRILALDTRDNLRRRWGDVYHVHLVARSAPHTSSAETDNLKAWLRENLVGAEIEEKTYCGQVRLTVPAHAEARSFTKYETGAIAETRRSRGIGNLLLLLEENKIALGVEYYSIGRTTLDEVFVNIVRQHGGEEENSGGGSSKRRWIPWK